MITQAICWTLLHSLWQGGLAALVAGAIILCTRRSRAVVRYNLLTADVLLFVLAVAVTFCLSLSPAAGRVAGVGTGVAAVHAPMVNEVFIRLMPETMGDRSAAESAFQWIGGFLNKHALVIVLIWMACMAVRLFQMTGGLYRIHLIQRKAALPVSREWEQRLGLLAIRMGIRRRVRLLQTGAIGMPAVAGVLKPVILVPLGMLAQLPPEQVETIFLHELAHIRRSDYLMNLLLHLSEAIFFFNPGVRWMVSLLREEREACCDDAVLAATDDEHLYFDALVGFMEFAVGRKELAMPLLGKGKPEMLWRVRRMLTRENKKLHIMEKTLLSFGLMALVTAGLISMREPQQEPVKKEPTAKPLVVGSGPAKVGVLADTVPAKESDKAGYGREYNASYGHHFSPLNISISDDGHVRKVKAVGTDEKNNTYVLTEVDDKVVEFSVNGKLIAKEHYSEYVDLFDQIEDAADAPIPPVPPVPTVPDMPPIPAVPDIPPVPAISPVPAIAPVPPVPPVPPVLSSNYWLKHIIRDLRSDKIILGDDPLKFTLNNEEFRVNGEKQPAEIFKRYQQKYLDRPNDHFIYDHRGGSTHTDISTDKEEPEEI